MATDSQLQQEINMSRLTIAPTDPSVPGSHAAAAATMDMQNQGAVVTI